MKLYGRLSSINVQKVVWCLGELGLREQLDYERIDAGLEFGVTKTPAYLALNPNALVPTWVDGTFVLWESHAIVRYLASVYAPGSLMPSDAKVRADSERWMDWKLGTLWPALRPAFVGLTRTPAERRDIGGITAAFGETSRLLAMLDASLAERAYCAGHSFTVGDIALGVAVHRWLQLGAGFPDVLGALPDLPALRAWHRRVTERPAFAALGE